MPFKLLDVLLKLGVNDKILKQYSEVFDFYCSRLNWDFRNAFLLSIFNEIKGDPNRLRTILHSADAGKIVAKILGLKFPVSEVSRYNNWTPESFYIEIEKELKKCEKENFVYADYLPMVKKFQNK